MFLLQLTACGAPSARLTFPLHPISKADGLTWYDTHHDGKPSFAISDEAGPRVATIYYSNSENGFADRSYRLGDYADRDVPHVILLLDSIPYQSMVDFYNAGHLRFFYPPQKVIAPFPSLTEVCYTDVLHAPPLPGMIDQSYDPDTQRQRAALWDRVYGYSQPWERRLDYHAKFWEYAMSFLHPQPWNSAEMERCRQTVEDSPNFVTLVYDGSASSMVCKYGKAGIEQTLREAEQFCLQLIYERHGAVKISMMADHGHNLMHSVNIPIDEYLTKAGFHCGESLHARNDVVVEINGLVTYAAVQTTEPETVAWTLIQHPHIQLVMYPQGDRVIVRNQHHAAAIECQNQKLRYVPIIDDVLGYNEMIADLKSSGKMDAEGFMSDADWFSATVDGQWPDAPRRIWDAFHRVAVNPPQVMVTIEDGWCAGLKQYEHYIDMASTHGGLNQLNSATFVMTMKSDPKSGSMRSRDVLNWLQPGFEPPVHSW